MSDKSTGVYLVKIEQKEKHPNADALELIKIGGYTVVAKLNQYEVGDYAVYIPPESIVDTTRPEFSFLDRGRKSELIKVKKIRNVYSQGLLIDKPSIECDVETNLADYFGISHYQPTEDENVNTEVREVRKPVDVSKYDIDSIRKYRFVFKDGEPVICTEKIHGCFSADTMVLTETGYKEICLIKPDDIIVSYSETTKKFNHNKVLTTLVQPSNGVKWRKITLENNKVIKCTENHLFLTKTGWVEAKNLTDKHDIISY